MKGFKFICRLFVGVALILLAGVLLYNLGKTILFPSLPIKNSSAFVQDVSGSMSDPDKTYAQDAIGKAARENKIVIVLDYQLTTFQVTDSYIDTVVGNLANNVYTNQPYVVYTYFKDTNTMKITTNIDKLENKTRPEVETDQQVVKEILYYQQNLKKEYGIRNWNFNLTPTYSKYAIWYTLGAVFAFILGIGVLPTDAGYRFPFRKNKKGNRAAE